MYLIPLGTIISLFPLLSSLILNIIYICNIFNSSWEGVAVLSLIRHKRHKKRKLTHFIEIFCIDSIIMLSSIKKCQDTKFAPLCLVSPTPLSFRVLNSSHRKRLYHSEERSDEIPLSSKSGPLSRTPTLRSME